MIRNAQSGAPDYILQWINNYIFKDVEGLMKNFLTVTQHISCKLKDSETKNALLELVPANNGKYYYLDDEGNYFEPGGQRHSIHPEGGHGFGTGRGSE